jgi:hypothetical protein
MTLSAELLDELARVYARAAVDRLLAKNEKAPAEDYRRGPDNDPIQEQEQKQDQHVECTAGNDPGAIG